MWPCYIPEFLSLLGELSQFPPGGPPPFHTTHAGLSLGTISMNKSDIIGFTHTLFFLKLLKTCVKKTENSILKLQTTFLQNSFYYICQFLTITAEKVTTITMFYFTLFETSRTLFFFVSTKFFRMH